MREADDFSWGNFYEKHNQSQPNAQNDWRNSVDD
jgi:hypothetical protein